MTALVTRRQLLKAGIAGGAGLALGNLPLAAVRAAARTTSTLPSGSSAPFDHVIVCMLENRSFDHFLGWLPGANGKQAGLSFLDTNGVSHGTFDLAPDYQGCSYADPDHSWQGGLVQMDGGKNDGFLKTALPGDVLPIGYYTQDTVNVLGTLVQNFATSDNYFCAILSATYPNRFYQHSAQTDRDSTTTTAPNGQQYSLLPAIWDQLTPLGTVGTVPTGRYYASDLPFTALWGPRYLPFTTTFDQFLIDCAAGTLPNVAFVDPSFNGESQGVSRDDHPHADVRAGEAFVDQVYTAVRNSPNWGRTVLVFNYDEWGGFYDHVPPPQVIDNNQVPNTGMNTKQLGFRVPLAVVSPLAGQGTITSGGAPFEHTSVLKMIEWRFGLNAMTARDANARNLAEILDPARLSGAVGPRTDLVTPPTPATAVSLPCSALTPPASVPETGWVPGLAVGSAAAAGAVMVRQHNRARAETPPGY